MIRAILIIICVFVLIRNHWVYRYQIIFSKAVLDYNTNLIDNNFKKYNEKRMIHNTAYCSSSICFLKFWEWNYKKFVNNEKLIYWIEKNISKLEKGE